MSSNDENSAGFKGQLSRSQKVGSDTDKLLLHNEMLWMI
jgi:hypothetical protein